MKYLILLLEKELIILTGYIQRQTTLDEAVDTSSYPSFFNLALLKFNRISTSVHCNFSTHSKLLNRLVDTQEITSK
jgi:hypothetical protein